ncbi:MAG TPA: phosphoribosyltransferase [Waterburya sp.]|jgi:putative phosphoribosyl transferase
MIGQLQNRTEAGELLAKKLTAFANRPDVLVLGLPRGGVPIAFEIAKALNAPLDICLVRKLGVPGQSELAMGAIASGNVMVINEDVVKWLKIPTDAIDRVVAKEQQELQRRDRAYRGNCPFPDVQHRTIILVDDGIATGSTMRAAIAALRKQQPDQIVVAIPVASSVTCDELRTQVDKIVCLIMPEPLSSISLWYEDFSQTTDEEVRHLLSKAANRPTTASRS